MALDQAVPNGLEGLIMSPAQQAAMKADLLRRSGYDIERNAKNEAQKVGEDAFGRGMGLSTLNAYYQAQVQRARDEALDKATIDSNAAVRAAQGAALGQAAQYVTAQQGRAQQESQFGRQLKQQQSLNTQNLVGGGLAGLAGAGMKTAGYVYGDKMKKALGGGPESPATPGAGPYAGAQAPSGQGTGDVRKAELAAPNLDAINPPAASPQLSDIASYSPSLGYGSGTNYGDYTQYDPSQFDMSAGWGNLADLIDQGAF